MLSFTITRWQAWAPGIHNMDQWHDWAHAPYCPIAGNDTPAIDLLPPMQRRRLSPMARMVFATAWPLAEQYPPMPVVYASRHGETTRGYELLHALASGEGLSPTSFGLSVHNAILGLWSIVRHETLESIALSVEGDSAEHAFVEACALLTQGHERALVLLAEEKPPAAYQTWTGDVLFPYAAAFVVEQGVDLDLTLSQAVQENDQSDLPSSLNLLRHLSLGSSHWHHRTGNRTWTWTRRH